ncbi:MAG TPA: DUF4388 domain-containing protein [Gemmatimonadaceae bacterium]|jgi:tetratricopeptide (TPR) repeat protein|nr:DUF4388 domain-containing protein [Gemmatimonadaceae bacterium]
MAIEGPLRELGIHDVFQLLDLSRKTGALTVTSALRDNRGTVYFDNGAVIYAAIRSNPHPLGELLVRSGKVSEGDLARARHLQQSGRDSRRLGEILVAIGAISQKELERQVRFQVEEVVFELTSWREGYFSFEEGEAPEVMPEAPVRISTESLLMEGARRIDEWSRIEGIVAHPGVVPALAVVPEDHAALLDLLPNEWEVLAEIDGGKDVRAIAAGLGRSEFEVAKIVYGLVTTGVVEIRDPASVRRASEGNGAEEAIHFVQQAKAALRSGALEPALSAARRAVATDPKSAEARLVLGRALARIGRHDEACDELRRALRLDALNADVHRELGYCAARRGEHVEAAGSWERYLRLVPAAPDAVQVRAAAETASRLGTLLQEYDDVG